MNNVTVAGSPTPLTPPKTVPQQISQKTIERLTVYNRCLKQLRSLAKSHTYSHELAKLAGVSAAQLRRDIMAVGYSGSPVKGYDINQLAQSIDNFLEAPNDQPVALVGVGNLGRAILTYFNGRRANLRIVAAFDNDPQKADRVIQATRCYPMTKLQNIINQQNISTAIITVPADQAPAVADILVNAGIRGILNFAPLHLNLPQSVFVENVDMAMALQKVAYFARKDRV